MERSDPDPVRKSADLARLALGDVRAEKLAADLHKILDHFRALARVPVLGVEPLVRPDVPGEGPRADEPQPSLERERLLAAAPRALDGFFAVPKTVERPQAPAPSPPRTHAEDR